MPYDIEKTVCWRCRKGGAKGDKPLVNIGNGNYACTDCLKYGSPKEADQSKLVETRLTAKEAEQMKKEQEEKTLKFLQDQKKEVENEKNK